MVVMGVDEEEELAALRKLLKSGPRTNRARPTGLEEAPAPAISDEQHIEESKKLLHLLQNHDKLDEAEKMMRNELRERELKFGPGAVETLQTATRLAMLLQAMKQADESLRLYKRVVEGYEVLPEYGKDHCDTLNAVNNYAVHLKYMQQYDKALPLYQRVLKGDEKEFGEEHPHTLDSVYNLARLYDATGDIEKALPLYRRELEGCAKYYGKEHEETGHSAVNLANFLARAGDKEGASKVAVDYSLVPTPQEEDGWKQEGKAGQPAA